MEELKAELAAKSCEVDFGEQKHSLFYSWSIYDEAAKNGMTIDAHALADPQRVMAEIAKLICACILCHRVVAVKLGVSIPKNAPTLPEVEALLMINPHQGKKAMEYVRTNMSTQVEQMVEQKKRLNEIS